MATPVLQLPNFSLFFTVKIDSSGISIGVVLIQVAHPIAYFSKQLSPRLEHVIDEMSVHASEHVNRSNTCKRARSNR